MRALPSRNTAVSIASKIVVLALLVTMAVQSSASTPPTYTVPASIDASGTHDVTEQLNQFIASVPDGSVITFQTNGRYRIEGTLLVNGRRDLTFEGNGALLFAETNGDTASCWVQCSLWPRSRSQWRIASGSSNITVKNLKVRGSNPHAGNHDDAYNSAYEAQHGFNIGNSNGVVLDNVTVTDVWGDFVEFIEHPTNAVVRNSHFERNGRQGIAVTGGDTILIDNIWMSDTRRASIDIEPIPKTVVRNVTIQNSYFGPGRLLFIANAGWDVPVENIKVLNNTLDREMNIVIRPPNANVRRGPYLIEGNVSRVNADPCPDCGMIFARYVDGLTVKDNTNPFRAASFNTYGVVSDATCGVALSGNAFPGADAEWYNATPSYACATTSTTTSSTSTTTTSTTTTTTTIAPAPTDSDSGETSDPTMTSSSFSGSLNKAWKVREFGFGAGSGPVDATVPFSRDSKLEVSLISPTGEVTKLTGASPVLLSAVSTVAGQWVLRVAGSAKANFTATVTYPAP